MRGKIMQPWRQRGPAGEEHPAAGEVAAAGRTGSAGASLPRVFVCVWLQELVPAQGEAGFTAPCPCTVTNVVLLRAACE